MLEVRTATGRDRADVARVLATAFDDDPLARWLVPHPQSLRRLFAAQARWIHGVPGCTDLALLAPRAPHSDDDIELSSVM